MGGSTQRGIRCARMDADQQAKAGTPGPVLYSCPVPPQTKKARALANKGAAMWIKIWLQGRVNHKNPTHVSHPAARLQLRAALPVGKASLG